jgi:adenylosuccinate synthase
LRRVGGEYGATTGRPRRCGWFDAVATNYAVMLNGITEMAITKMDVLDHLAEIQVCVAYELDGKRITTMPVDAEDLELAKPIYETLAGWQTPTTQVRTWADLPLNAQKYLDRLAELCGAKVGIVSVGPDRDETFMV